MTRSLRIGIDIGGCITRYPSVFAALGHVLITGGAKVYIVTDMSKGDAVASMHANKLGWLLSNSTLLNANWSELNDLCKTRLIEEHEIDIMIDDRPDYVAEGNFVGLVVSPRPSVPYYHPKWVNKSTSIVCVPPEEYEDFKSWRAFTKGKNGSIR